MDTNTRNQLIDRLLDMIEEPSQLAAILRCAFDRDNTQLPRFTSKAICTSDGYLQAGFVAADGRHHSGAFIGSKTELTASITALSNHAKLQMGEHLILMAGIRDWIATDYSR